MTQDLTLLIGTTKGAFLIRGQNRKDWHIFWPPL